MKASIFHLFKDCFFFFIFLLFFFCSSFYCLFSLSCSSLSWDSKRLYSQSKCGAGFHFGWHQALTVSTFCHKAAKNQNPGSTESLNALGLSGFDTAYFLGSLSSLAFDPYLQFLIILLLFEAFREIFKNIHFCFQRVVWCK